MPPSPPAFFGGLDDRVLEQPVGLVGDARLAPWTGFATADLIRALRVFPCYYFERMSGWLLS